MAFWREKAQCPFCGSTQFAGSLFVNDMPMTDKLSELGKQLGLSCAQCGKNVFEVIITQGKLVSAVGVSACEKCQKDFYDASSGCWREEDIPKTTYSVGTECCPRCGSQLRRLWWRGWNYTI